MKYNMHIQILNPTNMLQLVSYMQAVIMIIILPKYANKVNCAIFLSKAKILDTTILYYPAFGAAVQVL